MFFVYANGLPIYQSMNNDLVLVNTKMTLEVGKAGFLQFEIPSSNQYYNSLTPYSTIITVEMDDVEIFRGRVLTNKKNFDNMRSIYCEGNLAYLLDSVQKPERFVGKAHDLFAQIVANHNSRVEQSKWFEVGDVTIDNLDIIVSGQSDEIEDAETGKFNYNQIAINATSADWVNTFEYIQDCLIQYTGGYLRTRYANGTTYLDLLKDYDTEATQDIVFGKNILDITEEDSTEEAFSVLIPIGDENLTIESVNGGSDELVNEDAVAKYGRIYKTHVFDGVNDPNTLLENAQRFLENSTDPSPVITVTAIDMHLVDKEASPIYVGNKVHIVSIPHDIVDTYTCTKIEYEFDNPANNTYTFGNPKPSLTDRYRKNRERHRGGAGEVGDVVDEQLDEFFDAWINVSPESAHIDLGALYKKFQDTITILESSVGISMDAPSGNVNIKTLRTDCDNLGTKIDEQSAYIDLLNSDLSSRIELVSARHAELNSRELEHYTTLITSVNDAESKIDLNATSIRQLTGTVNYNSTTISALANELSSNIALEAAYRETTNALISGNTESVTQLQNDLEQQIQLEETHNTHLLSSIASLELRADNMSSEIRLKADKTTIDSRLVTINGELNAAKAKIDKLTSDFADIDEIISEKISAFDISAAILHAPVIRASTSISSDIMVSAPYLSASVAINENGKRVATQEYVTNLMGDYVTREWVLEQLSMYAPSNHTHGWGSITGKPTSFMPIKHRHTMSFSVSNAHTHMVTVNGMPYNTGGVTDNSTHSVSTDTGYYPG